MWAWLIAEENLKVLAAIGGVIAFLWSVGWAIYVRTADMRIKAAETAAKEEVQKGPSAAAKRAREQKPVPMERPQRFAAVLVFAIFAWSAGLIMVGTTWWLWKTFVIEKPLIIVTVCRGEESGGCPPTDAFVACGNPEDAVSYMKGKCKDIISQNIYGRSGGACGFNVIKFTCVQK